MTQVGLLPPLVSDWISFDSQGSIQLRIGKVEIGQGIVVAIARVAAEELDVHPSRITVICGDTGLCPDEGLTSGSRSIETSAPSVRKVSSAARALFLAAARNAPDAIDDGHFLASGVATGESYWSLAAMVDLRRPADDYANPKAVRSYRLVGREGGGVDLRQAVSGAAYIHDLVLPGMLHARVVRSPDRLAQLDAVPPEIVPHGVSLLQDGRFVAVIGEREDHVVRAEERLRMRLAWSNTPSERVDPLQEILTADMDDAPARSSSDEVANNEISVTVSREFIAHASIGPSCALALWEDDSLTVWSHTQGVFTLRPALAQMFDMDETAVRVIHVKSSGCYGHNGADDVAADAALIARRMPGRAVRVVWTRAQELANSPLGSAMKTRVLARLDEAGLIRSMHTVVVSGSHGRRPGSCGVGLLAGELRADPTPVGEVTDPTPAVGGGADRNGLPGYAIEDATVIKRIVVNPTVRTSSMRALGAHMNVTAIEALIDEAAKVVGRDPVAYRLAHLTDPRARAVVERVAAMADWPVAQPAGIGYARYKNKAAYCAVIAEIQLEDTVLVTRVWCALDGGLIVDPDSVINQTEGGIVQSISWTLKESMPLVGGSPAVEGWSDYPILRFNEVPEVRVELIDRPDEPSLGVGEAAQGPTAAALANAVAVALGERITAFPITRQRIIDKLTLG